MRREKAGAGHSLLLLLAAFIWGMAFVSQSKGMDYMGPLTFNGVRSLIGSLVLVIYLGIRHGAAGHKAGKTEEKRDWRLTVKAGVCCGLALTAASTLQQYGIQYTTVGKAGFITTLYIIFVPIAGIFFRRRVSGIVWLGAVMAAAGMYLLCMTESLSLGRGDLLVFLCALVFTVHILLVDYFSPRTDGVMVSCIQFAVCGILCGVGALVWENPTISQLQDGLGSLAYAGVLSCGVAYTLQIVGQRGVNPTVAALILSLESVFATVSGWIAYKIGFLTTDQTMTGRQIVGCILVFAAVVLVQLPEKWFRFGRS
ncbi:MAG: DMT family transporter [Lachnospiraceae bacterium]|nr:DMT family transporter [Lachnospiraceae bacterium]